MEDTSRKPNENAPAAGNTWHIHLQGLVQGVGFRPFVYQLAMAKKVKGAVSNGVDGLHIWLNSSMEEANLFLEAILENPPPLSRILVHSLKQDSHQSFSTFSIIEAPPDAAPNLWITPDLSICPSCLSELNDPQNRRYRYPFITCTQCGPRYSIMQALPFERHFTSMRDFPMCPECRAEYENPAHARFYAQTNSCKTCGVKMEVWDAHAQPLGLQQEEILPFIIEKIRAGNILAIKGIGGFLLMVDAANAMAIKTLRERKHRPSKPFAVLYPSMELLKQNTEISADEANKLTSLEAPIVLVKTSARMHQTLATTELAPGIDRLGVMLPYAPLLQLIAQDFGKPLVATSANISGSPILFKNEDALATLGSIADYIVLNNRDIVAPQDDSVLCFAEKSGIPILLRRSRGWAPAFPPYVAQTKETILATGALLKSSFTIAHQQQVYISQYLGSTETWEAQQVYRHTLAQVQGLLRAKPALILTDKHPDYFSAELAKELSLTQQVPLMAIQHHKAHFGAILGEKGLHLSEEPVLGVIWDGTGLGDDGHSWGGEFFRYENREMTRIGQFSYFPYLLGDKMAREPRISALALLGNETPEAVKCLFSATEWSLYSTMLQQYDGILTSSAGRLFDAVACLLLGIGKQSYEGEAAMLLEAEGRKWCRKNGYFFEKRYLENVQCKQEIPVRTLVQEILSDLLQGSQVALIAAKFHYSLAFIIKQIADIQGIKHIAFSGGVFQNSLLVDMVHSLCSKHFTLHFHRHLSPNDENISFGQFVEASASSPSKHQLRPDLNRTKASASTGFEAD